MLPKLWTEFQNAPQAKNRAFVPINPTLPHTVLHLKLILDIKVDKEWSWCTTHDHFQGSFGPATED